MTLRYSSPQAFGEKSTFSVNGLRPWGQAESCEVGGRQTAKWRIIFERFQRIQGGVDDLPSPARSFGWASRLGANNDARVRMTLVGRICRLRPTSQNSPSFALLRKAVGTAYSREPGLLLLGYPLSARCGVG